MNSQYLKYDNVIKFSGPVSKLKVLPAGIYQVEQDSFGDIYLTEFETHTDNLIALPGSHAEKISHDVDEFLTEKIRDKFKKYKLLYKRGILMFGPPGTGKTSVVHLLMRSAVSKNMVVLVNPRPSLVDVAVSEIRTVEKNDRPVMVVWEEFETWVNDYEGDLLDLLDGVSQVDNTFYIATTNYIEQIPPRIRNRPSRFADVIEIGPPDRDLRRAFLQAKIDPEDDIDLDDWVNKTEGFSIDHLKDLVISVLVLGLSLDKAVDKIFRMAQEESTPQPKFASKRLPKAKAFTNTEIKALNSGGMYVGEEAEFENSPVTSPR